MECYCCNIDGNRETFNFGQQIVNFQQPSNIFFWKLAFGNFNLWIGKNIYYILYYTVHILHYIYIYTTLYIYYTIHILHYTYTTLYIYYTIHTLHIYYTIHILHYTYTTLYIYYTIHRLHYTYTTQNIDYTLHTLHYTYTKLYIHYTTHILHTIHILYIIYTRLYWDWADRDQQKGTTLYCILIGWVISNFRPWKQILMTH